MQQDFQIPVFVEERAGLRRHREAVRLGIPLPRGLLREASGAVVVAADSGRSLEQQARALARWPDQSIKWLLLDVLASVGAHQRAALLVRPGDPVQDNRVASAVPLKIGEHGGTLLVDTGAACFELGGERGALLGAVRVGGASLLDGLGARIRLLDCSAREYAAFAAKAYVEEAGPVRAAVVLEGQLRRAGRTAALFKARFTFIVRATSLRLEFQLRNPRAASHRGGLWDLADRGTVRFEDLSLRMTPGAPATELRWCAESPEPMRSQRPSPWTLYQDSSGGESWDSDNHVDGTGSLSVAFRGYQVRTADGAGQTATTAGARATPYLCVSSGDGSIAVTAMDFWQNFPKALRWDGRTVSVGLFPGECRVPFALQGGEQKRHTLLLEFLPPDQETSIPALQHPLAAWVDPAWIEESGALGSFVTARRDPNDAYLRYVNAIVDGPHSFERKRELIDEYGWRNFGDLYADHEGVRHPGPRPLVSHYNNQYDFIHGALTHFLRSGDARWWRLAQDAARHTIDIDIYHTNQDKAAFNHGLFWHTDHYKPAATCTHRTYSRRNGRGRAYGGGPSNEHNYTSGLLLYFYLSGDAEAARAVRELADWVIAMDDGSRNLLGLLDSGPTGLASKTVDFAYHKPGRGAGNSINALLDGYQLLQERPYVAKAEELICRCIHPADDIDALQLAEPEHRWSYLVFLQVLGKYLDLKVEWGEADYMFHYARDSLLHYAAWMAHNEVPYKDVLHKVELPTETWPAHDVRKAHVLHVAAKYSPLALQSRLHERAAFFFGRCLQDLLSFETAFLTRPLVILCVYGHIHAYFQVHPGVAVEVRAADYSYGRPAVFKPQ
ncbi:MAG: hypothetical protein ACRETH_01970, partial [Steroidobacteraceae bacterium]